MKYKTFTKVSVSITTLTILTALPLMFFIGVHPIVAAVLLWLYVSLCFYLAYVNMRIYKYLSPKGYFLGNIKEICISNGYTIYNWDCGEHDREEFYDLGYTEAEEAFDYALQCE